MTYTFFNHTMTAQEFFTLNWDQLPYEIQHVLKYQNTEIEQLEEEIRDYEEEIDEIRDEKNDYERLLQHLFGIIERDGLDEQFEVSLERKGYYFAALKREFAGYR